MEEFSLELREEEFLGHFTLRTLAEIFTGSINVNH